MTPSSKPVPVRETLVACCGVWEAVTLPECSLEDGGNLGAVGKFPERVKSVLIKAHALEELCLLPSFIKRYNTGADKEQRRQGVEGSHVIKPPSAGSARGLESSNGEGLFCLPPPLLCDFEFFVYPLWAIFA